MFARRELQVTACLAAIVLFGWYFSTGSDSRATFRILSVGQGDCAVLQHRGVTVLIDSGPRSGSFDAGARIIANKLRKYGVERIDVVMITHPDLDHVGGLASLGRRFEIGKVVIPHHFSDQMELRSELKSAGIDQGSVVAAADGMKMAFGELSIRCLVPPWEKGAPENDGSLVTLVYFAGQRVALLVGDLGSNSDEWLLPKVEGGFPILQAGHHGSGTSTSLWMLKKVKPKFVVISCGAGNSYGHPAKAVLDRVQAVRASVLRTDRDGDVGWMFTQGGSVEMRKFD